MKRLILFHADWSAPSRVARDTIQAYLEAQSIDDLRFEVRSEEDSVEIICHLGLRCEPSHAVGNAPIALFEDDLFLAATFFHEHPSGEQILQWIHQHT